MAYKNVLNSQVNESSLSSLIRAHPKWLTVDDYGRPQRLPAASYTCLFYKLCQMSLHHRNPGRPPCSSHCTRKCSLCAPFCQSESQRRTPCLLLSSEQKIPTSSSRHQHHLLLSKVPSCIFSSAQELMTVNRSQCTFFRNHLF